MVGPGTKHEGGPQHRGDDRRAGQGPLGQQPLQLRLVDPEGEAGVGAERGVLRQGDGVVGPGAVDGGAGHQHHLAEPGGAGRLQHPPGAADVDPGHQVLVGDGVVDPGQVHQDVGALEVRPEVGAGHVDEVELQRPGPIARLPHVEPHQSADGHRPGQAPQHGLAEEPRHAGDHYRGGGRPGGVAPGRGGIAESRRGVSGSLHAHRLAA